ncbi:cobalamin-dependent protein [Patescibacteria group bacterium]|nr:cobalamin-dependent protein [Patescibacteria group bacterium]
MSICERKALLLSGPQYHNERKPITAQISRSYEHIDPLGIAIVSTVLEKHGFERKWLPITPKKVDKLEKYIEEVGFIFISARHFDTSLAQKVIKMANKHGKTTIVGGYGPTFNPSAFEKATVRVRGEAEPVFKQLMDDLLSGKPEEIYDATKLPPFDLKDYIWPDRNIFPSSLLPGGNRFKRYPQEWQRGCKNWCSFCSPVRLQKRGVRVRKIPDIIAEIEHLKLKKGDYVFSTDLNTTAVPSEELGELFRHLKDRGIRWFTEGTVAPLLEDLENGGNLLRLMSAQKEIGGCYSFLYGADDLVKERVAGSLDKKVALLKKAVQVFREFSIPLNFSIVLGLDHHQYPETFFQTALILEEANASNIFFQIATPYLGTPWGNSVYREGRVFETETTHFNHNQPVATPKQMTKEQLQQGTYWIIRQFNNPEKIAKTARANLNSSVMSRNPTLGVFLSGLLWGFERYLSILELSARGYVDKKTQKELDAQFKAWQKRKS